MQFTSTPENLSDVQWNFGEGWVSGENPSYSFSSLGEFVVLVQGMYCDSVFADTLQLTLTDCDGNFETPPLSLDASFDVTDELTVSFSSISENLQTITWQFGDGTFGEGASTTHTYPSWGEYDVIVVGQYCDSTLTDTLSIVHADCEGNFEIPPLSQNATATQLADSTYLFSSTSQNLENITWFFPDGEISGQDVEYTFADTGFYEIEVCGEYCDSLVCAVVSVEVSVGVEEFKVSTIQGLKVWPNPTSGVLNMESDEVIESVSILDPLGRPLIHHKAVTKNLVLDVSFLPAGTYLIEATDKNGSVFSLPLIIER